MSYTYVGNNTPSFRNILVTSTSYKRDVSKSQDMENLNCTNPDTLLSNSSPSPAPKLALLKRTKYNSTETIFMRNALLAPDIDEIVYCVARAVLLKLKENENVQEKRYLTAFDERRRKLFPEFYDMTPSFRDVLNFFTEMFAARDISAECGVMAVAYVDRLFKETDITFDKTNWRPIVFTAVLLASKVWEDANVWNSDYVDIFEGLEVEAINTLEREFLYKINFDLLLLPSTYTKYYFELRSMAIVSDDTFPVKPLDKRLATTLEARCLGAQEKAKMALIHPVKSKSDSATYEGGKGLLSLDDLRRVYKNKDFYYVKCT